MGGNGRGNEGLRSQYYCQFHCHCQCQCQFSQSLDWSRGAVQLLLQAQRRLSLAPTISIFMQTITPSDLHQHRMQISAAYGTMGSAWSRIPDSGSIWMLQFVAHFSIKSSTLALPPAGERQPAIFKLTPRIAQKKLESCKKWNKKTTKLYSYIGAYI